MSILDVLVCIYIFLKINAISFSLLWLLGEKNLKTTYEAYVSMQIALTSMPYLGPQRKNFEALKFPRIKIANCPHCIFPVCWTF